MGWDWALFHSLPEEGKSGEEVRIWWSEGKSQAPSLGFLGLLPECCLPGQWIAWDWPILVTGKGTSGIQCIRLVLKIQ